MKSTKLPRVMSLESASVGAEDCKFENESNQWEVIRPLQPAAFFSTDSMSSEQRQKLAKERREERARYIGKKLYTVIKHFGLNSF